MITITERKTKVSCGDIFENSEYDILKHYLIDYFFPEIYYICLLVSEAMKI